MALRWSPKHAKPIAPISTYAADYDWNVEHRAKRRSFVKGYSLPFQLSITSVEPLTKLLFFLGAQLYNRCLDSVNLLIIKGLVQLFSELPTVAIMPSRLAVDLKSSSDNWHWQLISS